MTKPLWHRPHVIQWYLSCRIKDKPWLQGGLWGRGGKARGIYRLIRNERRLNRVPRRRTDRRLPENHFRRRAAATVRRRHRRRRRRRLWRHRSRPEKGESGRTVSRTGKLLRPEFAVHDRDVVARRVTRAWKKCCCRLMNTLWPEVLVVPREKS